MDFRAPIGTDDFGLVRRNRWAYVDKSPLIGALLEDRARLHLFTRPRRFGRSTNLSMLRAFFGRAPTDNTALFSDLEIWRSERAKAHFQRHPVLWLSLRDLRAPGWEAARSELANRVSGAARDLGWLLGHPATSAAERSDLLTLIDRRAPDALLRRALRLLLDLAHRASGERVVVLIDDLDTPLCAAHAAGYLDEVLGFFQDFLGGLGSHPALFLGVMTAVLPVYVPALFPGERGPATHTLLHARHQAAFGFTVAEVQALAAEAGAEDLAPQLQRWCGGTRCGATSLSNPRSVMGVLADPKRALRLHGPALSSDALAVRALTQGPLAADLARWLEGRAVRQPLAPTPDLAALEERPEHARSLLLHSGVLRASRVFSDGEALLILPNEETLGAVSGLLERWLVQAAAGSVELERLIRSMVGGDAARLEQGLGALVARALAQAGAARPPVQRVIETFSLALLVRLRDAWAVEIRVAGAHTCVRLTPKRAGRPGVALAFGAGDPGSEQTLAEALALLEPDEAALREAGAQLTRRYAVVFDDTRVKLRMARQK